MSHLIVEAQVGPQVAMHQYWSACLVYRQPIYNVLNDLIRITTSST